MSTTLSRRRHDVGLRLSDLIAQVAGGGQNELRSRILCHIVEPATDTIGARFGALSVLDPIGNGLVAFVTVGIDAQQPKTSAGVRAGMARSVEWCSRELRSGISIGLRSR